MSFYRGHVRAWAVFFVCSFIHVAATAAPLTLTDALRRTLANSPALAVFPISEREADAMQLQARLRPAPELGLDIENIAGSGDFNGADSAEYTLALSQTIELGGKRDRRIEVAQWQRRGVAADYVVARVDALAHTATRFIECARTQAVSEWAQRRLAWAERSVQTASSRASAGAGSSADVKRLEIAAVRARIALARAQSHQLQARGDLAAMWGATPSDVDTVSASLDTLPTLEPESVWLDRLQSSPQLQRFVTQQRLLAAQQQLAATQATPDVTLSLGARRLEADHANALVLGASMPLAFGSRNQAATAQARAQYDRNTVEQQRTTLEMQAALRNLYQQLLITRIEAQLLRSDALPKAKLAYREFERGYQAGRFSTLELLTAQDEQLALEREAIDAEASFHQQQIALQQLTGQAIGEVSP
jgi:cobalt-zinc-cadmium efflux system outer membrane protein